MSKDAQRDSVGLAWWDLVLGTAVAVYQASLKSSFGIEELFSNLQEKYHCFRTEKDV